MRRMVRDEPRTLCKDRHALQFRDKPPALRKGRHAPPHDGDNRAPCVRTAAGYASQKGPTRGV